MSKQPLPEARLLAIHCFTSKRRRPTDTSGLSLLLAEWLGIARPSVRILRGWYSIKCATPADARYLCDWFGGEVVQGRVVRGALTS